jgi:hypothetical protein
VHKSGDELSVDNDFLRSAELLKEKWESEYHEFELREEEEPADILNENITEEEVRKCVETSKSGKSPGFDSVPIDVLKTGNVNHYLWQLFSTCFENGIIPTQWNKIIIRPIPKKGKNPKVPLNTRGINLIVAIAKLYTLVLNTRFKYFLENNGILCDEQNAYRTLRSCIDHLYILCTVFRIRKHEKKDTYVCFIDFTHAFDVINHTLLLTKLSALGVWGKCYPAINSLYKDMKGSIKIDNMYTEWFPIVSGIRQGDIIAPTMFNLYVNDLALEIRDMGLGIPLLGGDIISLLMFADDIVFIADTPEALQKMIDKASDWCERWRLFINITKTHIMHFRGNQMPLTNVTFKYRNKIIDKVDKTLYL